MSDQDPFETNTQNTNTNTNTDGDPVQTQTDPFADQLSAIKNEEGKQKYGSVEDALKALQASQQHIRTLETEKRTQSEELENARAELAKMGSIDDFVKKISPNAAPELQKETPSVSEGISEDKILELLNKQLEARTAKEQEEANLKSVVEGLSSVYGDKVAEHIKAKAAELQTTPAALREMAKSNPAIALNLLGGAAKPSTAPSQSTTISPTSVPDNNPRPTVERGIARGGYSNKELMELFRKSKAHTNKRLGLDNE